MDGHFREPIKAKIQRCPLCNTKGVEVQHFTVKHMVLEEIKERAVETKYYICMDKGCEIVYFNNKNYVVFTKADIKVPIWYKRDADPRYACYCSEVTEDQVIEAIKKGAHTVAEICEVTHAMEKSDCKERNPLGKCCHPIIQAIIDKEENL